MKFSEIAAISGKSGLFKVLKPTRTGVIVESLADDKKRMAINTNHKVSVLNEISIYAHTEEGTVPLQDVFREIHTTFAGELPVTNQSNEAELFDFLKKVLPNFDEDKVYASDIKKLVNWYHIIVGISPDLFNKEQEEAEKQDKEEKSASA